MGTYEKGDQKPLHGRSGTKESTEVSQLITKGATERQTGINFEGVQEANNLEVPLNVANHHRRQDQLPSMQARYNSASPQRGNDSSASGMVLDIEKDESIAVSSFTSTNKMSQLPNSTKDSHYEERFYGVFVFEDKDVENIDTT